MSLFKPQLIIDWRILSDTDEQWKNIFGNNHAIVLEIGFGRGEFIMEQAHIHPKINYVGIELMDSQYQDKIESLLAQIQHKDLRNIRLIYNAKADIVIPQIFHNETIKEIFINYPPPFKKPYPFVLRLFWPREQGGNAFAQILYNALEIGGSIHIVTDNIDYAYEIVWNFENNITGKIIAETSSHIPSTMPDSYLKDDRNRYFGQRYIHIIKIKEDRD